MKQFPFTNRLKIFLLGLTCGIVIQFIPSIAARTSAEIDNCICHEQSPADFCQNTRLPSSNPILHRLGYTVAYDGRMKTALWVYEELTKDSITGDADRSHCRFSQDPDIPTIIQADLSDYRRSGFDRGHLARAGNYRSSQVAMCETFYLSNIAPQVPSFNQEYWKKLEDHVQSLTNLYDEVRVVTGPLYLPHETPNGRYVTYQVIGRYNRKLCPRKIR